ncbi:class I SAM-dependent methyltransferase [Synechococcus sp. CCAP 1479/9]|uniref:class I SAM-dependent methyltransferase n=1 Tax=Synechococcus sp. CCAP 1479/9 TaxID=1221593 RepID=UPI001C21A54A
MVKTSVLFLIKQKSRSESNMMTQCRICGATLSSSGYSAAAPAITSISTHLAIPTQTYICRNCGHGQSPDLPKIQEFYDTQYRISLQSDQHDQLYEVRDGQPVFRTQRQAEMLAAIGLPLNARVLDFGAAKGTTLRTFLESRPDLRPSIFDVSDDYVGFWQGWVPASEQVTHRLPADWQGCFDLVTAHFVLEHVVDPIGTLKCLAELLTPGGKVFFTVPDPLSNTGDFLVVDHVNHFTASSLKRTCELAGLVVHTLSRELFRGAYVVIAERAVVSASSSGGPQTDIGSDITQAIDALAFWSKALGFLDADQHVEAHVPTAIYGAGFYGALITSRLHQKPLCFLDRNKYLQGQDYLGVAVLAPEDCPDSIRRIYPGLNPLHARAILADADTWMPQAAKIHYLADR